MDIVSFELTWRLVKDQNFEKMIKCLLDREDTQDNQSAVTGTSDSGIKLIEIPNGSMNPLKSQQTMNTLDMAPALVRTQNRIMKKTAAPDDLIMLRNGNVVSPPQQVPIKLFHAENRTEGSPTHGAASRYIKTDFYGESLFTKFRKILSHDKVEDKADMKEIVATLIKAQSIYCTEISKQGTKEWISLRQDQKNTRMKRGTLNVNGSDLEEIKHRIGADIVKSCETRVRECIMFAKEIPGFNNLHKNDQKALIKGSRQEIAIPGVLRSIDFEENIISLQPALHFTFEEFLLFLDGDEDFLEFIKLAAGKSIWQNITDEEEVLIKAIILTNADRCTNLQERENIARMHRELVSGLVFLLEEKAEDVRKRMEELEYMLSICSCISSKYLNIVIK